MRTVLLVILVVVAHVAAIAGLVVFQGCGTPTGGSLPAYGNEDVIMPPSAPVVDMQVEPVRRQRMAAPVAVPAYPVEVTTYVVRKGDSLSTIANRFGLDVSEIMTINQIADKNKIRAGQKLILPGKHSVDAAPPPRTTPRVPVAAAAGSGSYVVQPGDCLSAIAVKHKTSVAAIKSANSLPSDMIRVGQKLTIPGANSPTSSSRTPAPAAAVPAIPARLMPDDDSAPIIDMPPAPAPVSAADEDAMSPPAPARADTTAVDASGGESFRTYVVGENEDLYSVGLLWNVSVAKIKEINALSDTTLKPGQQLKIPTSD